jgi:hypothetical protein
VEAEPGRLGVGHPLVDVLAFALSPLAGAGATELLGIRFRTPTGLRAGGSVEEAVDKGALRRRCEVSAQSGVEEAAVVAAVAPLRFPERSLEAETGALERSLLGGVFDLGRCLDPVRGGVRKHRVASSA